MSLSVWAPRTIAWTSSTLTPAAIARYVRKRALSSTPAEPMTRSRGKPVTCLATNTIASSGFDTTISTASGAYFFTSAQMPLTMPALMLISSSRDWPGLRGTPAVITTTSAPAIASGLSVATKRRAVEALPRAALRQVERAALGGGPALMSMSTSSPSSFCTAHWATAAPTLPPAPTIAIFGTLDHAGLISPGPGGCKARVCRTRHRTAIRSSRAPRLRDLAAARLRRLRDAVRARVLRRVVPAGPPHPRGHVVAGQQQRASSSTCCRRWRAPTTTSSRC